MNSNLRGWSASGRLGGKVSGINGHFAWEHWKMGKLGQRIEYWLNKTENTFIISNSEWTPTWCHVNCSWVAVISNAYCCLTNEALQNLIWRSSASGFVGSAIAVFLRARWKVEQWQLCRYVQFTDSWNWDPPTCAGRTRGNHPCSPWFQHESAAKSNRSEDATNMSGWVCQCDRGFFAASNGCLCELHLEEHM